MMAVNDDSSLGFCERVVICPHHVEGHGVLNSDSAAEISLAL